MAGSDGDGRQSRLIARISAAFADVELPATDVPLARSPGYLINSLTELQGLRWHEITPRMAFLHAEVLFVLSPEAFPYYLPAFMVAAVREDDPAAPIGEAVLCALFPPLERDEPARARFEEQVSRLSRSQVEVVREFLHFLAERDTAEYEDIEDEVIPTPQAALHRYWARAPGID